MNETQRQIAVLSGYKPTSTDPEYKLIRPRGKVAGTRHEQNENWPRMTASQFARLPGYEKTAVYFATSASRLWQAKWHQNFRAAFDWFEERLAERVQERQLETRRRIGEESA